MIYLDANYIVKCYLREAGSAQVLRLVQTAQGEAVLFMLALNFIPLCIGVSARGTYQHKTQRLCGNSLKRTNVPGFGIGSQ